MNKDSLNFINLATEGSSVICDKLKSLIINKDDMSIKMRLYEVRQENLWIHLPMTTFDKRDLADNHLLFACALDDEDFEEIFKQYGNVSEEICELYWQDHVLDFVTDAIDFINQSPDMFKHYCTQDYIVLENLIKVIEYCSPRLERALPEVGDYEFFEFKQAIDITRVSLEAENAIENLDSVTVAQLYDKLSACSQLGINVPGAKQAIAKKLLDAKKLEELQEHFA